MDISSPEIVAVRLKQERDRIGLTLVAMAEAAGVGRATQANYESGATSPGVDYIYRLQSIGVDTLYLLTGVKSSEVLSTNQPETLWAAAECARQMKFKFAQGETSNRGLGILMVKLYRMLTDTTYEAAAVPENPHAKAIEAPHE